jgi:hypothetical protein
MFKVRQGVIVTHGDGVQGDFDIEVFYGKGI